MTEIDAGTLVNIQYYGAIRVAARVTGEEHSVGLGVSLYRLLNDIAEIHDKSFMDEVFVNGDGIRDDVMITVNGVVVSGARATEIDVNAGDVVALFPIFPGGG